LHTPCTTTIVLASVLTIIGAIPGHAQDLETVTARASRYVLDYEEQLGSIIAEEQYTQGARWLRPSRGRRGSPRIDETTRELRSNYLILCAGGLWLGFRNVLEVDGREDGIPKCEVILEWALRAIHLRRCSEMERIVRSSLSIMRNNGMSTMSDAATTWLSFPRTRLNNLDITASLRSRDSLARLSGSGIGSI